MIEQKYKILKFEAAILWFFVFNESDRDFVLLQKYLTNKKYVGVVMVLEGWGTRDEGCGEMTEGGERIQEVGGETQAGGVISVIHVAAGHGHEEVVDVEEEENPQPLPGARCRAKLETFEESLEATRKAKADTKKLVKRLDPAVKKELDARKRLKQLSWSLLPDAPLRKHQKKASPVRVECLLTAGTPIKPPARKLQPWQIRKHAGLQDPSRDTGDHEVAGQIRCLTPISSTSTAEGSALGELMVDFSSGLLNPVPTTSVTSGKAPPAPAHAKRIINMGTEKAAADLEEWLNSVESDNEVDEADIQTDGQTDIQTDGQTNTLFHQMTPAHIFEDMDTDLGAWLTNNDKDSDRLLRDLVPTDDLTFDWVQDHSTFRGKRETFTGIAGPTFPVTVETTPSDVFLKFFDDNFFDLVIHQTNQYSTRQIDQNLTPHSRLNYFINVDRGEMARFFAIPILQGLAPNPVEKSYWGKMAISP